MFSNSKFLKKIRLCVLFVFFSFLYALPLKVMAQSGGGFDTAIEVDGHSSFTGYADYITHLYNFSIKAGTALTILMLIYAGYKYLTSQGNPTAINEAKDIVIGSLSGFAFLLLVYLVLKIIGINPA